MPTFCDRELLAVGSTKARAQFSGDQRLRSLYYPPFVVLLLIVLLQLFPTFHFEGTRECQGPQLPHLGEKGTRELSSANTFSVDFDAAELLLLQLAFLFPECR